MDPTLLTAVTAFLVALGGGAWKLIDRYDKKAQIREDRMIEILKQNIADLEAENRGLKVLLAAREADGDAWKEQLIRAGEEPIPPRWTAVTP